MINLLFIGCLYSEDKKGGYLEMSKRGYQYAAQNLQEALIDGLLCNKEVKLHVLSIPSLSTFPKGCTKPKITDCKFIYKNDCLGQSFGFINLPFLNHIHQNRIDNYIEQWYVRNKKHKVIIVYALLRSQMQYAIAAKQRHPDVKLCIIIPDLPMFMNCNKYYKMLGLQKNDIEVIDNLLHLFDSYVVLSESMVKQLKISKKPHIVVEGIYNNLETNISCMEKLPYKTIMYAGGIQTRYGVFDLIEAFHRIKDEKYRLILCGPCLEMEKLNTYLSLDSRIKYYGLVSTEKVRILQGKVTLLVNPRHSFEEFTKYSFPSKTLEYMASGTPVLMNNLESIPNEYKQYIYFFNDESIDGMKQQIEFVCSLDDTELLDKGRKAKEFILREKNPIVQVNSIVRLIQSV